MGESRFAMKTLTTRRQPSTFDSMRARLVAKSGVDSGEGFVLTADETAIGRAETCAIQIADAQASRRHCLIRRTPEGWLLVDLDSRNGTAVNGVPVSNRLLRPGDEIRIGYTVFAFIADEGRGRPASPHPPAAAPAGVLTTILHERPPKEDAPDFSAGLTQRIDAGLRARATLTDLAALLRATPDRTAFLDKVLKILFRVLSAARGSILCFEPGSTRVLDESSRRRDGEPDAEPLILGQELLDAVIRKGHSTLAESETASPAGAGAKPPKKGNAIRGRVASLLAVPLGAPQAVRGIIALESEAGLSFTEDDLDFAEAVGAVAGSALDTLDRLARAEAEEGELRRALAGGYDLVGTSPPMKAVYEQIAKAAPAEATVLIRGESGTGKELVARALHTNSPRATRPFLACNCGAIPEGLAESELFGHEKGAFTGAVVRRQGVFELAHAGTLFLDEVGELDPKCQTKLLRVLEARTLRRVGGSEDVAIDVRFLAATNKDLAALVKEGKFREDLYYRLQVVEILLPPLRDRREDIPMLAEFFLDRLRRQVGRRVEGIDPEALEQLKAHAWPGNVRELKNCVERAVILGNEPVIRAKDLALPAPAPPPPAAAPAPVEVLPLREIERRAVLEALDQCGWNRSAAAEKLGIQRSTLYEKMKAYGIRTPE
jgi:transcriptional regulator with GAF, ATPase, and Fis domain